MSFGQLVTAVLLGRAEAGSVLAACLETCRKTEMWEPRVSMYFSTSYWEPKGL